MGKKDDLKTRVKQFQMLELPGQPMSMHMGTSYLVNDLWKEVKRLRAEQAHTSDAGCDSPGAEKCDQCQKTGIANPHNH